MIHWWLPLAFVLGFRWRYLLLSDSRWNNRGLRIQTEWSINISKQQSLGDLFAGTIGGLLPGLLQLRNLYRCLVFVLVQSVGG